MNFKLYTIIRVEIFQLSEKDSKTEVESRISVLLNQCFTNSAILYNFGQRHSLRQHINIKIWSPVLRRLTEVQEP